MPRTTWEYAVYELQVAKGKLTTSFSFDAHSFQSALNQYGEDGWELVSVPDVNMYQGGTMAMVAVFKRPLTEHAASSAPPPLPGA